MNFIRSNNVNVYRNIFINGKYFAILIKFIISLVTNSPEKTWQKRL